MTAKDRVRKHRAQNRENGFVRLEVCLGLGVRKCAKQKNVSMREVVEDALIAQLIDHAQPVTNTPTT